MMIHFGKIARAAAALVFFYLLPVTFLLRDFMSTHFQKNLGIMGGLLKIALYGPGRFAPRPRLTPSTAIELQSSVCRLFQQLRQMILPNHGLGMRAVSPRLFADGDQDESPVF